ncbi:NAD-dependent succinate-semialdehyde dehydrogenase [Brevibacillus sp. NRS-1366]|uniref:NAD-dependent succinate-semialdehyde dehydrogenase n=1 Tax=Brevibacillus sp. NRS-1366 TaxID=3233899 RepID=UPI003D25E2A9
MTRTISLIDLKHLHMYVNGNWVNANDEATFAVVNPSTGETIGRVPNAGGAETKAAIEAAHQAFPAWSTRTAQERASLMLRLRDLMLEHREELAAIMSMEMGKVYKEALGEVAYAASFLEWYAEEGKRIYGETIPASSPNKRLLVIKQPVGVVAAITPWNFPLAMMTRKLGPALAAGCTGIVKPASLSPLSAIAFCKLVEMAGFPAGTVNVVTGASQPISDEIFSNPIVRKVSFTGSTEVGKQLVKQSAEQLKRLSLELGGHAPFIVFGDADLEAAAAGVLASKFRNAGQTCVCANRIYVQRGVLESFSKLFAAKVAALTVGNSLENDVEIGPLVNAGGLAKVTEHVNDAIGKGAKVLCGGKQLGEQGLFYAPTVLGDVTPDMLISFEETFGPVAPIIVFDSEEEVIRQANDTDYGLAAYLYTSDLKRAIRVTEALQFGIIGLNDALPGVAQAPFGGMKQSGYGREGGHQGLEEYLDTKYVSLGM